MFLTASELTTRQLPEVTKLITGSDQKITNEIILEAIDLFKGYLNSYYDTNEVFSKTGDERNLTVLRHLKAVVIYDLHARRSTTYNEVVKIGYEEAMRWLEAVSQGKIKPILPLLQVDTDGDGLPDRDSEFIKFGSNKKYTSEF
ncbi:MAG: DUF1320 domain-containing protein [Flavobacteriaceae bacterium]|nr:MAG: DUF1320 domain-containing protein [Flavobacteriaceae bacterium]